MSSELILDGKEFISATEAGRCFGYTKDYILLLAKEGKILGRKIGHKWYVNPDSVATHFEKAKFDQEDKKRQVSLERKKELKTHSFRRTETQVRMALLETLVIVIIGLSLGSVGYVGSVSHTASVLESQGSFFESTARAWYKILSSIFPTESRVLQEMPHVEIQPEVERKDAEMDTQGLILFPEGNESSQVIDSIRDSFSDEVVMSRDATNSDTGIITPIFRDSSDESYRFLMVPVTKKATD